MKCDPQHGVGLLQNLSFGQQPTEDTKIKTDDTRIRNTNNENFCRLSIVLDEKSKNGRIIFRGRRTKINENKQCQLNICVWCMLNLYVFIMKIAKILITVIIERTGSLFDGATLLFRCSESKHDSTMQRRKCERKERKK